MAQHDFVIANQGFPAFRTDLNNFLQAVGTTHSGTSLPTGAVAGLIWLDTTSATAPVLKYYDGTDNITLATINHTTNTVDFNDSAISTPLTVTGNATAGAELRLPEDTDNGTNYIALKAPDTIASNLTLTLPSADGTANQVLTTNGSGVLSFATVGGLAWQSVVTGATLSAVSGRGYFINTTSNACTVTLPASPTIGDTIAIIDYAGTSQTNKITLNGNGNKIDASSVNKTIQTNKQAIIITYSDVTRGWLLSSASLEGTLGLVGSPASPTIGTATVTSDTTATVVFTAPSDNGSSPITSYTATSSPAGGTGTLSQSGSGTITVTGLTKQTSYTFTVTATNAIGTSDPSSASNSITTPNSYSVDFLVIAGGGGTGVGNGGGGGAGGYRTSTQTLGVGTVVTVTVGDGGTAATSGSNSSIAGSGLTTITSAGGGAGGGGSANGANGGSGGGCGNGGVPGGLGNTPSTSPSQGNNGGSGFASAPPNFCTGGGGGASAVGVDGTTTVSGNGGAGTASSITGSSVTRAGGGGGAISTGTAGSGGAGGGGNGSVGGAGTNGTANTGGGAGGTSVTGAGANGGKGVVILSVPTANYSSTSTGSPTVTTSGSNTILQFNGSGSYTG